MNDIIRNEGKRYTQKSEIKTMDSSLNQDDREILESYENDAWVSVSTLALTLTYKAAAKSTSVKY